MAGVDVVADPNGVRSRIGLSGQYAAVDEYLTGFENLVMVGRLYGFDKKRARRRADELLERFSLSDAAHRPSKTYSGGMRRRLDLAGALVAQPEVLVLDEPTTGLDPRGRLEMWDVIRELVSSGTTLLLTTQYLEEADVLADEIVVIDHGMAIAQGTSNELKSQIGGERVELVVSHGADIERTKAAMAAITNGDVQVDAVTRTLTAPAAAGAQTLMEVLRSLDTEQIALDDVGLRRPTLDDVFLALTGQYTHTEPEAGTSAESKRNAKRKEVAS